MVRVVVLVVRVLFGNFGENPPNFGYSPKYFGVDVSL